jgi:phosphatidylserine/phosphatidylglycerophosphate/cardiolipin synthase-like enzyme
MAAALPSGFEDCNAGDLEALSAALAGRRLSFPISSLALQRAALRASEKILADLTALHDRGFSEQQAAYFTHELARERAEAAQNQPVLELVVTGPDHGGMLRDTAVVVDQLFREAQSRVLVVGFALYEGKTVFATLAERMNSLQDLEVTLCLDVSRKANDTSRAPDIALRAARDFDRWHWPSGCRKPQVFYDPRWLAFDSESRAVLHAKCIVIDRQKALITSANPTPAAYRKNIELGIVIQGGDIPRSIDDHFGRLIAAKSLQQLLL